MVLLIIAACSGTGKSTLARRLLAENPRLRLSVSHTTRAPRPGERDGVDYVFTDRADFEARIRRGDLVEWAEYAGNLYGTSRQVVEAARAQGHDLLFDVEVVGAANLKQAWPEAVSVFILPPSWAELESRLRGRGTESDGTFARRMEIARREIEAAERFDYLIVNADVESAARELASVYGAARLRTAERRGLLDHLLDPTPTRD